MKNVNRDYLVTVNAKTADIVPPRDMKFYVTDIYTCNIFFQLTINDTDSLFNKAPEENADKYKLILRVLKPDDTPKETIANFMYQSGNAFYYVADLDPEFTNVIGICQCELLIDTIVTTEDGERQEISTTEPFQYEVEKSIFSDLDEVIESDPDYPLLIDTLATKDYVRKAIENMDLLGFATRDYVNQVILGGDFDLSDYVTNEEFNSALSSKANSSHTHDYYVTDEELTEALINFSGGSIDLSGYVTEEELDRALANLSGGGNIDLDSYVTDKELTEALLNKANATHYHSEYATHDYVDEVVESTITNGNINLDNYVTDEELNGALANKADSEHTHDEYVTDTELTAKNYATTSQIPTTLPADGGNSDTVGGYSIWVGSLAEYYALENIETDVLYFIEEEDE